MLLIVLLFIPAQAVEVGGILQSNVRISTSGEYFDFQDSIVFTPRWTTQNAITTVVDFDIRWQYPSTVSILEDSQFNENIQPFSIRPNDLWFRIQTDQHQIKIGYQKVLWGVATGVSLLNTVNGLDLRDPTRFDQRLSSPLIHSRSTFGKWSFEAVVSPFFTPAQLSTSGIGLLPTPEDAFEIDGEPIDIRSAKGTLTLPESSINNTQFASRFLFSGPNINIAGSYYHGFDSLPQASGELLLTGFQTNQNRVDVGIPLVYPSIDILGLSSTVSLPLNSIGWAEVTYSLPQETKLIASQSQLEALEVLGTISEVPSPLPQTQTQGNTPYWKWIVGVERYIGPVLCNAQWVHGFFTERQKQDILDYGMLSIRWNVTPTIRIDSGTAFNQTGAVLSSDLYFLIQDELEISVGGFLSPAKNDSAFYSYQELQHIRMKTTLQF
jgi:hypothetical protein